MGTKIRRIILLIITVLFTLTIAFFYVGGKYIRNSDAVSVNTVYVSFYNFPSGAQTYGLPSECVMGDEENGYYIYVCEQREVSGESGYFVKKDEVYVAESDGIFSAVKNMDDLDEAVIIGDLDRLGEGLRIKPVDDTDV